VEIAQHAVAASSLAQRFEQYLCGRDEDIPLTEAALLVASHRYPDLDVAHYLDRIDAIARGIHSRVEQEPSLQKRIVALNHYLFHDLGFSPNTDDYYDPKNSFLNDVLERRLGIPITLGILYIDAGGRIGLPLQGICFPGHFLVKCKTGDGLVILDPYAGGLSLSMTDLQRRLREARGGEVSKAIVAGMLVGATNKEILLRMLRNLKAIYLRNSELDQALAIMRWIVCAAPDQPSEIRDRGMVYQEMDCFRAAISDFEHYLELAPSSDDALEIQQRLVDLRRCASRLN
jgi:regulator of sirC expression with transglutaminase-like and TPR domain